MSPVIRRSVLSALLSVPLVVSGQPKEIFDGKSLTGWHVDGAAAWKAADGVLTGEDDEKGKGSILWTDAEYGDFTVELEFRFSGEIDSGVFLREPGEQIQIGISRSLKRDMTCSPYIEGGKGYPAEAKGVKEALKPGEWNRMKIAVHGKNYKVTLNGVEVLSYDSSPKKLSGPVGLQVHPGVKMKVEYRNVTIDPA